MAIIFSAAEKRIRDFVRKALDYNLARRVSKSSYFNAAHYEDVSGLRFASKFLAARHYVEIGEASGFSPSKHFDPVLYRNSFEDLYDFDGNLLVHYEEYGENEGRGVIFSRVIKCRTGEASFEENFDPSTVTADEISRIVLESGLFDEKFYGRQCRAFNIERDPTIFHYLNYGELQGLKPSAFFDPIYYARTYPDLSALEYPLIVHFIVYGRFEGRLAIEAVDEQWKSVIEMICASDLFDFEFYSSEAGLNFTSSEDSANHYCSVGERLGLKPSRQFDPKFYLSNNPDLMGLEMPLLWHFIAHGESEGRQAYFDMSEYLLRGDAVYDDNKRNIIVVLHEGSLTGAPILGAAMIKSLSDKYNIISIVMRPGDISRYLLSDSFLHLSPSSGAKKSNFITSRNARYLLDGLLKICHIDAILCNSIETSGFAKAAAAISISVVSLIHEFSEYTRPLDKMWDGLYYSTIPIFPAKIVLQSSKVAKREGELLAAVVQPQGKIADLAQSPSSDDEEVLRLITQSKLEKKTIVVGLGHVQIRKGVDLFISSAAEIMTRGIIPDPLFLWIGGGYDPNNDMSVSVWLSDQVERSGLAQNFMFLPPVSFLTLQAIYKNVDVLLLTSRLDPFPNVAVDALWYGLPVVCFERTTGIAEFLCDAGFGELVAGYLDVRSAAEAAENAVNSEALQRPSKRLMDAAREKLDIKRYCRIIEKAIDDAAVITAQEGDDLIILRESNVICDEMLGSHRLDSSIPSDRWYIRTSASGMHRSPGMSRRPALGFSPHIYIEGRDEFGKPPFANPLADYLKKGSPAGRWVHDVISLSESDAALPDNFTARSKVAIHIHLHYAEYLEEIIERIYINETRPDLFISVTSQESYDRVVSFMNNISDISSVVIRVPNRGRDIASFLLDFSKELSVYEVVGHIHGKKSVLIEGSGADEWRKFLFEHLLGGSYRAIDVIVREFGRDETVGLIFPEDPNITGWTGNKEIAKKICSDAGIEADGIGEIEFPNGNMFFCRPEIFKKINSIGLTIESFPPEPVGYDGSFLHALERLPTILCEDAGYVWKTIYARGIQR